MNITINQKKMDLKEIVWRDNPIHQDEALLLVNEYIKDKKGIDVDACVDLHNPFSSVRQVQRLAHVVPFCTAYFRDKFKENE